MGNKIFIVLLLSGVVLNLGFSRAPCSDKVTKKDLEKEIKVLQKKVDFLEVEIQRNHGDFGSLFFGRRPKNHWDPFKEMERMQDEMDHRFQRSFGRIGPEQGMFTTSMNFDYDFGFKDDGGYYELMIDMQGLDEKSLDVKIEGESITIKGYYDKQESQESPDSFYSSKNFGSFLSIVPLPVDADASKAETQRKKDRLIIKIPKRS